jgi:hypothetical protein
MPWMRTAIGVGEGGLQFSGGGAKHRAVAWLGVRRTPLVAGAVCLAGAGVLVANALVPMPVSAEVFGLPSGGLFYRVLPSHYATPTRMGYPVHSPWSVTVGAGVTLVVPGIVGVVGVSPVAPAVVGNSPAVPAVGAAVVSLVGAADLPPVAALSSPRDVGVVDPTTVYSPAAARPVAAPAEASVVAAQAVPMTAAQQTAATALAAANLTAANALAAANLTAANALAAANLTAANAAAAAAKTASVAAAAAEATRLQALADAYAVAHPGG